MYSSLIVKLVVKQQRKIKPASILEMTDANGLMRLMTAEKGEETPMEKIYQI